METEYIQFPKLLHEELALLYEYKNNYALLKEEYYEIFGIHLSHINLASLYIKIGDKLSRSEAVDQLFEFKTIYLNLYKKIRGDFLKFYDKLPDNAEYNAKNLDKDIVQNLLNHWTISYRHKFLKFFNIEYNED